MDRKHIQELQIEAVWIQIVGKKVDAGW